MCYQIKYELSVLNNEPIVALIDVNEINFDEEEYDSDYDESDDESDDESIDENDHCYIEYFEENDPCYIEYFEELSNEF